MECLLSVIEIMQFQEYILKLEATEKDNIQMIKFHANIPISNIIEHDDNANNTQSKLESVKIMAYIIYGKYIEPGARFEVNISWTMRAQLTQSLGNLDVILANDEMDLEQLLMIFEECKKEMVMLLKYSLGRFRNQPAYDELASIFDDNDDYSHKINTASL